MQQPPFTGGRVRHDGFSTKTKFFLVLTPILIVALVSSGVWVAGNTTIGLALFTNANLEDGLQAHWTFDSNAISSTTVSDRLGTYNGTYNNVSGGGGTEASSTVFTSAGSESWTVPDGVTSVTVKAWGAGGAGGSDFEAGTPGNGGGGGYIEGTIDVTASENLTVYVGGGGTVDTGSSDGGGGGGYSGVFRAANPLFVAGAGGGGGAPDAGKNGGNGGAGGGESGADGTNGTDGTGLGTGGTQSAGGTGGPGASSENGENGSSLAGGDGGQTGGSTGGTNGGGSGGIDVIGGDGGGGGGAGYFGGGGGGLEGGGGGGGGGSSWATSTASATTTSSGSGTTAANTGDPDYAGSAGQGGGSATVGGDGRVVINYDVPAEGGSGATQSALDSAAPGKIGQAFSFNGSNERIEMGDVLDQTGSFSLHAWIKPDSKTATSGRIIVKDDGSTNGWGLSLGDGSSSTLNFFIRGTTPTNTETGTVITNDDWYNVIAVFDTSANTKRIYVNGVLEAEDTSVTGDPVNNTATTSIGGSDTSGAFFKGTIDDVRVYNRALNEDDVGRLSQLNRTTKINTSLQTNPELLVDLDGYWTFDGDDVSTSTAFDTSGQNRNAEYIFGAANLTSVSSSTVFASAESTSWTVPDGVTSVTVKAWGAGGGGGGGGTDNSGGAGGGGGFAQGTLSVTAGESLNIHVGGGGSGGTSSGGVGTGGGGGGRSEVGKTAYSNKGDLSEASYDSVSTSVTSEDAFPHGFEFGSNGTKLYVLGSQHDLVYQYSVSPAWDAGNISYDNATTSVINEDSSARGVSFSSDGTKMYYLGGGNTAVYQYTLSSAWDITSASYDSVSKAVGSESSFAQGLTFSSDGTKMYYLGREGDATDAVYQYSLSPAWDLSSASYDSVSKVVGSEDTNPSDVAFNSDGTKMYISGDANDTIYQYTLTTGWNLSTASYASKSLAVGGQETTPLDVTLKSDDTKMYVIGQDSDTVYQYSVATSTDSPLITAGSGGGGGGNASTTAGGAGGAGGGEIGSAGGGSGDAGGGGGGTQSAGGAGGSGGETSGAAGTHLSGGDGAYDAGTGGGASGGASNGGAGGQATTDKGTGGGGGSGYYGGGGGSSASTTGAGGGAYDTEVLGDSPTLYWRFEETSGTNANDETANNNDGTYSGTHSLNQTGLISEGVAVDLNSGGVVDGGSIMSSVSSATYEAWVKFNNLPTSGNRQIIAEWGGTVVGFSLGVRGDGTFVARSAQDSTEITGGSVSAGTTYYVVAVYDAAGDTMHLYVDGQEVASTTGMTGSANGSNGGGVGGNGNVDTGSDSEVSLDAVVDEFAAWNSALSGATIQSHYNAGLGGGIEAGGGGGGGGSSFATSTASATSTSSGSGTSAGNNGDGDYAGSAGQGGSAGGTNSAGSAGNDGRIVLSYDISDTSFENFNLASGKVGQAVTLSKATSTGGVESNQEYLTLGDNFDRNDTDDMTLSAWIYWDPADATNEIIFAKRSGTAASDTGYILYLATTTDKLIFEASDGTDEYSLTSANTIPEEEWTHVVVVWDEDSAANTELYINGVADGATDSGTIGNVGSLTNAVTATIGADADGESSYVGRIDDMRVYGRALTAERIERMYQVNATTRISMTLQTNPQLRSGLVGHWTFDGPTMYTNVGDSSGQGNNGVLVGQNSTTTAIGRLGQALAFDGTDDYVNVGNTAETVRTVAFWMRADDTTSRKIINIDGTDQIELNGSNEVVATSFPSATVYVDGQTGSATIDGDWHHVVVTDSTGVSASSFEIGRVSTGYYDGILDDVRIYTRALSIDEVQRLYELAQ